MESPHPDRVWYTTCYQALVICLLAQCCQISKADTRPFEERLERPTELINIRKVRSDVSVPCLKLLEYQAGASR